MGKPEALAGSIMKNKPIQATCRDRYAQATIFGMIIGTCPYRDCEFLHLIPFSGPDRFTQEECEQCRRPFWLRHSRLDPQAYTPEEFDAEFKLKPGTNIIFTRSPEPLPDPDQETVNAFRHKTLFRLSD